MRAPTMRRPRSEHTACHIAHVRDWPLYAKVWITWGIQGWVPGVVVGYQRSRVVVKITGKAQSGVDVRSVLAWRKSERTRTCVARSPNNVVARRGETPPKKHNPPSCLVQSAVRGNTAGIPPNGRGRTGTFTTEQTAPVPE